MDAYRFVVNFRREERTDADAPPTWRGWVQIIYPTDSGAPAVDRRYFIDITEVSDVMAEMIRDSRGEDAR